MKNKLDFFKSKTFVYIILGAVVLLALFLRVYKIGEVPPSPDWDEAALGYNAYSILLTGNDEYGKFLPVVLQSFDDYKPALYTYLIIPFIKLFDLSIISVRLPSVLFGTIAIIAVFFIIKELFGDEIKFGKFKINSYAVALCTSFFVAISPWHIQFSRVGFEANVGLTFNLLVILFFLKGLKNKYLLFLSTFFGAVNLYVYQSEKVYTPLLFLILIVVHWGRLIKIPIKHIVLSVFVGLLVAVPMIVFVLTNPNALSRAKGVSVFSDTTALLSSNVEKIRRDVDNHDSLGFILDNRRVDYVKAFVLGYLSHFEPNWLFYRGDIARHHAPFMGNLYLFMFPFMLLGLYVLIFSDVDRKIKYFVILFMLIAPIPASVTKDVPHAVRAINFIPSFDLLASFGVSVFFLFVLSKKRYLQAIIFGTTAIIVFLNFSYYLNQYFVQQNYFNSEYWQYGWKDAVSYTVKQAEKFDHVVISNQPPLDQSYIFFLFYLKYDPAQYQKEGGTISGGFNRSHKAFGKYEFREINWDKDKFAKKTLYLGRPVDLPDNIGRTIYYLNGNPAIIFSNRYE